MHRLANLAGRTDVAARNQKVCTTDESAIGKQVIGWLGAKRARFPSGQYPERNNTKGKIWLAPHEGALPTNSMAFSHNFAMEVSED